MKKLSVVISGKGGVGKTTVASFLARALASYGKVILIDSDPSMNLNTTLGIERPKPISELKELIRERTVVGEGLYKLNPYVDDIIEKYSKSIGNISLLVLGTIKEAYSGCICPETAFLRALLRKLLLEDSHIILDTEAGLEFIGRGLAERFSHMLIITEPSLKSIETSNRIYELSVDLNIRRIYCIANKIKSEEDIDIIKRGIKFKIIEYIPYDKSLKEIDFGRKNIFDINTEFYEKIKNIVKILLKENFYQSS